MNIPHYYHMFYAKDVFEFLGTLPPPKGIKSPADIIITMILYSHAFKYVRRCLWKGSTLAEHISDINKAISCLQRLKAQVEISE